LKLRSKFILKIYFFFLNSKLNGRKLGFNAPLSRIPSSMYGEFMHWCFYHKVICMCCFRFSYNFR